MADEGNLPEEKMVDGDKLIEDAAKEGVEGTPVTEPKETDKPEPDKTDKPEEVDWKAKFEEKDKQFREYQGGITPKLQELAKLKESPDLLEQLVEKLSGKSKQSTEETIPNLEEEITSIDRDIRAYKDSGYGDDIFEVKALVRQRNTLTRQLKFERENAESQTQTKMIGDYLLQFPKTTAEHIEELTLIMAEKKKQGKVFDLLDAEEAWRGRQTDKIATQKAKEAREQKDKATGARTQDGLPVEPEKPEDEAEKEFRDFIAPPGEPIVFPS